MINEQIDPFFKVWLRGPPLLLSSLTSRGVIYLPLLVGLGTSFSKRGKEEEKKNRGKEEKGKRKREENEKRTKGEEKRKRRNVKKKKRGKKETLGKEKVPICLVGIESPEPLPKWRSYSQVDRDSPNNRSPFFRSITIQCIRGVWTGSWLASFFIKYRSKVYTLKPSC